MRIPDRLPLPLSERTASLTAQLVARQGQEIDIAVSGIPFIRANYNDIPETEDTVPMNKDQFDAEQEPGEQSLSFWWRRSQDSFHEGAGNLYQESRTDTQSLSGFYDSSGVDVWTKGQVTLLPKMSPISTVSTGTFSRAGYSTTDGVPAIGIIFDGGLGVMTSASISTEDNIHNPVGQTVVDGFVSDDTFYDITQEKNFFEGTIGGPGSSWPLGGGDTPVRLTFGHARPWVIGGRSIWQPDLTDTPGTSQTPLFQNPNKGFTYYALAEGPRGMFFAGHDGRVSYIQSVSLDSDGSIPSLGGATVVANFPEGELVTEIAVLAGQFIGIASNKGFRVGTIDGESITYGPLLFSPGGMASAIHTDGQFFRVAFQSGTPETWRIDTSTALSDGVYPYARDLICTGGAYVTSMVTFGSQVIMTLNDGTVHASGGVVSTGYLQTGRIRYRMVEDKLFKSILLETPPLPANTSIVVQGIEETGTFFDIGVDNVQGTTDVDYGIPTELGPQRQMAFKITLASSDGVNSPTLNSYLVRALPSVSPQRELVIPLLCFDHEVAHSGVQYGHRGYAEERLAALKQLEALGDLVTFQDFGTKVPSGQVCIITGVKYVQTAPSKIAAGKGGLLLLTLRTATA